MRATTSLSKASQLEWMRVSWADFFFSACHVPMWLELSDWGWGLLLPPVPNLSRPAAFKQPSRRRRFNTGRRHGQRQIGNTETPKQKRGRAFFWSGLVMKGSKWLQGMASPILNLRCVGCISLLALSRQVHTRTCCGSGRKREATCVKMVFSHHQFVPFF